MAKKTESEPSAELVLVQGKSVASQLPSPLRAVFTELKAALVTAEQTVRKNNRVVIQSWFAVGALVDKVDSNESKFGAKATRLLAQALSLALNTNISEEHLWTQARVSKIYTLPQIEKLLDRAEKRGSTFSWTHLRYLTSLLTMPKAEVVRKKLENRVITEALSSDQLLNEIAAYKRKRAATHASSGGTRGPKVKPPKSPAMACRQIIKYKRDTENRVQGWDDVLFGWVAQIGPDQASEGLIEEMEEARTEAFLGKTLYEETAAKLEKAIKRAKKLLTQKGELAETQEEEQVEEEFEEEPQIEEEKPTPRKTKVHEHNGHAEHKKPLSVQERIRRAKEKAAAK